MKPHIIKYRTYGKLPFHVVVIHGGPGAAGEMAPVARALASEFNVLEPFQTAGTVAGQIEELKKLFQKLIDQPITLIGFSWGAWLSFMFSEKYPAFVKKLILIGSGPFEKKYAATINNTRLDRLDGDEKEIFMTTLHELNDADPQRGNIILKKLQPLMLKTDGYDPVTSDSEPVNFDTKIFHDVWQEAAKFRESGNLLKLCKNIKCPVVAIHGDYDPHPAVGVQKPLSSNLKNFQFVLLNKCGHKPWIEHKAKDEFFKILRNEIV